MEELIRYKNWNEKLGIWNTWTVHEASTCAVFYSHIHEYFEAEKFTDVNIICQNRVFKCHRLILAAASKYFDSMFGGNFKESHTSDVTLEDIDGATFELTLQYMYKGKLPIFGDENVCSLLHAAVGLQLNYVEERCIHYLTQKNVPMDWALDIFLYACVTQMKALIPCTSHCILKHLDHLSTKDAFLGMSCEELSTLLKFVQPDGSSKSEYSLLNAIRRWVSHLTCSLEEKNTSFLKLTQNLSFERIPVVFIDGPHYDNAGLQPDLSIHSENNRNLDPSLHVYINFKYRQSPEYSHFQTSTFTPGKGGKGETWRTSHDIIPAIGDLRIVPLKNRLYSLKLEADNEQLKFVSTSSVNFSVDTQTLTTPPSRDFIDSLVRDDLSMCGHKNDIYACINGIGGTKVFKYNCELDKWFQIFDAENEEFSPTLITSCHDQLYVVGYPVQGPHYLNEIRVYDDRTEKFKLLAQSETALHTGRNNGICCHKDKIYVTKLHSNVIGMEVFYPVAGKWSIVCSGPPLQCSAVFGFKHRVVSFENKLQIFSTAFKFDWEPVVTQCYDSFAEKWDEPNFDLGDFTAKKFHRGELSFNLVAPTLIDAIVYTPSSLEY